MNKFLKYFILILVIGYIILPSHVLSNNNLSSFQQPVEFRGIRWGADTINYPYLFLKSDNVGGIELFGRECENLKLGSADLSEITYHFYNDKFYQVSIGVRNDSDHQHLLDELTEAFGTPYKETGFYIWENGSFLISLYPEGARISYLPILNKIKRD